MSPQWVCSHHAPCCRLAYCGCSPDLAGMNFRHNAMGKQPVVVSGFLILPLRLNPFSTLLVVVTANLPPGAQKMKIPQTLNIDSKARNRYLYAPTCATKRKPEEARRPGSVFEEPYPVKIHQGERRRGGQHAVCCLSAAGAESPGLSPEMFAVGRFTRWGASG